MKLKNKEKMEQNI